MNGLPATYRPRRSSTKRWIMGLVVLPALAGLTASGQGNPSLSATRWQLGWHGGTSTYIGDQEATRLDQPALGAFAGGELVHQFTAAVGLGVAAQVVRNPRLDEPDSYRSTLSALFRITSAPLQRGSATVPATQRPPVDSRPARFTWVVASPSSPATAETLAEQLRADGFEPVVRSSRIDRTTRHRITIGGYASRSDAQANRESLPAAYRADAWLLALQSDR